MFVGVDLGTTSAKVVAYDTAGRIITEAESQYPLYSPLPDHAEQSPEEIFEAVLSSVSEVTHALADAGRRVTCVAFSAAMHSLIALNEDGEPLTAALTYADNRALAQASRIRAEPGSLSLHRRTGTPVHPMSPLTKLVWFREEEPETFETAARWVSVKEYVFYRLFGEFVVDHSVASATGLFNLRSLDWDEEALGIAGVRAEKLSRPVPTTHAVRGLEEAYAERLGVEPDTPFVVGANDGVLANLGVGAVDPGVFSVSIGTSGAVRTTVPEPTVDEEGRTFCYALMEDAWVIGGPINNGGIAFRWLRDEIFPELKESAEAEGRDPYDLMDELAAGVEAGSGDLVFLPYLVGERAPHWNAGAKGVLFGLTLKHRREHVIRAVLEGITCQLYSVAQSLEGVAGHPAQIRATGGFARSPSWRQIVADVFGQEIVFPESYQSSCLGAALLGMKALGEIGSLDAVKTMLGTEGHEGRQRPQEHNAHAYGRLVQSFNRLYERLEPEFSEEPPGSSPPARDDQSAG